MAQEVSRAGLAARLMHFDGAVFMRFGLWTLAAGVAVAAAVLVGGSEAGLRRITATLTAVQGVPAQPPREALLRDNEMQRVAESLKQINSERNRVVERLEAIERHLDDLTGSISRNTQMPPAPPLRATDGSSPPPETIAMNSAPSAPANSSSAANVIAPSQQQPAAAPAQETPAPDTPATAKVEFGIDLGGAQTIDGLRVLWTAAKGRYGTQLEGLRPIVTIRENSRPGSMELRLVAGPLPSAAVAARLCMTITAAGSICQPAVFDGQRLALR